MAINLLLDIVGLKSSHVTVRAPQALILAAAITVVCIEAVEITFCSLDRTNQIGLGHLPWLDIVQACYFSDFGHVHGCDSPLCHK